MPLIRRFIEFSLVAIGNGPGDHEIAPRAGAPAVVVTLNVYRSQLCDNTTHGNSYFDADQNTLLADSSLSSCQS
jgi:hypothetical protein